MTNNNYQRLIEVLKPPCKYHNVENCIVCDGASLIHVGDVFAKMTHEQVSKVGHDLMWYWWNCGADKSLQEIVIENTLNNGQDETLSADDIRLKLPAKSLINFLTSIFL